MPPNPLSVTPECVRADFSSDGAVAHYARAAVSVGLWRSEEAVFRQFFELDDLVLDCGCGAGRISLGLWRLGFRRILGFDFAEPMIAQARQLAVEAGCEIPFMAADAADLPFPEGTFDAAVFAFNGLMQIPGRERRRHVMREIRRVVRPGGRFVFTSHDRSEPTQAPYWEEERERWRRGLQDPRLLEFGDRYFPWDEGVTFMHLPEPDEIQEDLALTGWQLLFGSSRRELANESAKVREFSDECRFWGCQNPALAQDCAKSGA